MRAEQKLAKIIINTLQVGTELVNEVLTPVYIEPSRVVVENQPNLIVPDAAIENQLNLIVPDAGLFILISFERQQPYNFASEYHNFENNTKLKEVLTKNFYSTFAIELYSKDSSAIEYQEKILLYLNSFKSKQLQEEYNISIQTTNNSWTSLSFLEGASRMYRFRLSVGMYHDISIENEITYIKTINTSTILSPK